MLLYEIQYTKVLVVFSVGFRFKRLFRFLSIIIIRRRRRHPRNKVDLWKNNNNNKTFKGGQLLVAVLSALVLPAMPATDQSPTLNLLFTSFFCLSPLYPLLSVCY